MFELWMLIVWCLSVFGAANGVAVSGLLKNFREWVTYTDIIRNDYGELTSATLRKFNLFGKLVHCPMCLGFWFGILWGIALFDISGQILATNFFQSIVLNGFLGSATSWLLYLWIQYRQFDDGKSQKKCKGCGAD